MRTTVNIDDDVLREAKELSRLNGQGLGRTLSELARRGLSRGGHRIVEENGIPVIVRDRPGVRVTPELVRQLLYEGELDIDE